MSSNNTHPQIERPRHGYHLLKNPNGHIETWFARVNSKGTASVWCKAGRETSSDRVGGLALTQRRYELIGAAPDYVSILAAEMAGYEIAKPEDYKRLELVFNASNMPGYLFTFLKPVQNQDGLCYNLLIAAVHQTSFHKEQDTEIVYLPYARFLSADLNSPYYFTILMDRAVNLKISDIESFYEDMWQNLTVTNFPKVSNAPNRPLKLTM